MQQEHITKRIVINQQSLLLGKLRNFFRRSIIKYFISSIFIAIGIPTLFGGFIWTFLGTFVCLCILSMIAIYFSSKFQSKKMQFDANVTFNEAEIIIEHLNKQLIERKNWDWILRSQENKYGFFITIQKRPRFELILLKTGLTDNEANILRSLLLKNVRADGKK